MVTECAASFSEITAQYRKYKSSLAHGRTFLFNVLYNIGPIVTSARHMVYVVYQPKYSRIKTWQNFGMEAG